MAFEDRLKKTGTSLTIRAVYSPSSRVMRYGSRPYRDSFPSNASRSMYVRSKDSLPSRPSLDNGTQRCRFSVGPLYCDSTLKGS